MVMILLATGWLLVAVAGVYIFRIDADLQEANRTIKSWREASKVKNREIEEWMSTAHDFEVSLRMVLDELEATR